MLIPGLVSITFRPLDPTAIAALCVRAGLRAVEWGGDVHVPHGDVERARVVAHLTREHGLAVSAYGSYYRTGESEAAGLAFAAVLDSAVALGAPVIRVWAGRRDAKDADDAYRAAVVADVHRIADLAAAAGVAIAFEYHGGTLTATDADAQRLLAACGHPAVGTFWQPHVGADAASASAGLRAILPRLRNLHVFSWAGHERLPLAARAADWRSWLRLAASTGRDHVCTLEFVAGDRTEQLEEDAATLRAWLAEIGSEGPVREIRRI